MLPFDALDDFNYKIKQLFPSFHSRGILYA